MTTILPWPLAPPRGSALPDDEWRWTRRTSLTIRLLELLSSSASRREPPARPSTEELRELYRRALARQRACPLHNPELEADLEAGLARWERTRSWPPVPAMTIDRGGT